jgi:hypothetical protein
MLSYSFLAVLISGCTDNLVLVVSSHTCVWSYLHHLTVTSVTVALAVLVLAPWAVQPVSQGAKVSKYHRDMTRVQMLAKMFPHLKLLCWLFIGPTLGFDTKQSNSFLIKFSVFYNKTRF